MRPIRVLGHLLPAAFLTFSSIAGAAAETTEPAVYKCKQASGGIAYQDYPCKGGVVVEIKPDVVDPAAVARLERAQAEFNRGAAQRRIEEEALSLRREELDLRRRELDAAQVAQSGTSVPNALYGPAYGFDVPYVTKRPNRFRPRDHVDERRFVPQRRVPAVIRRPHAG